MIIGTSERKLKILDQINYAKRLLPKIKFAWLPIKLRNDNESNGKWLWLENYIMVGVTNHVIIDFEVYSTTIKSVHINSSSEETILDYGGYRPTKGEFFEYGTRTSPILLTPSIKPSDDYLISLNLKFVMQQWFYEKLVDFIEQKEQELEEYDNNK